MRHLVITAAAIMAIYPVVAEAQILQLRQADTGSSKIEATVGEVIEIEVFVDFEQVRAMGISLFLSVEDGGIGMVGHDEADQSRPFAPGPLFATAPVTNVVLSETEDPIGKTLPGLQLDYAVLLAEEAQSPAQSGVVATLRLLAVSPMEAVRIVVDDNPIRESRLLLGDRISERRFTSVSGMEIAVVDPNTAVNGAAWGEVKRSGI